MSNREQFQKMTVKELSEYLKRKGVTGLNKKTKPTLVDMAYRHRTPSPQSSRRVSPKRVLPTQRINLLNLPEEIMKNISEYVSSDPLNITIERLRKVYNGKPILSQVLRLLVQSGINMDEDLKIGGTKINALKYAIDMRDLDLVKKLLDAGIYPNTIIQKDINALLYAKRKKEKSIEELLIQYGATLPRHLAS